MIARATRDTTYDELLAVYVSVGRESTQRIDDLRLSVAAAATGD